MTINRRGRITDREKLGRCYQPGRRGHGPAASIISLQDIREGLKEQGYRRIRFTDRRLPKYEATACRRGRKFNLVLNRFGDIRRRSREGWCERRGRIVESAPVRTAPRLRFDDAEIMERGRIDGARCQNFLEYTLERRKIYFDTDSARIRSESYRLLNRLAHVLKRCPSAKIEIAGHTDSRGSLEYNQELSEARAISVTRYLFDRGISKSRMSPVGYGEERPVASNLTESGMARNRRIEFVVDWDESKDDDDLAGYN